MTRPLWTLAEIVTASGGQFDLAEADAAATDQGRAEAAGLPDPDRAISGVSIDTRTLAPGDLFVPLTDARDGHEFVSAAFARGAAAALVREGYARQPHDGVLIRVDDPLAALARIGMAARGRLSDKARVIAVTGSAGKTGTKEMLRACLNVCAASSENVHAPEKSFNNHWGVPLTLARMPATTEFGVFEIGMNHADEIRPLTKMVRPHVAIVTNVLPVHVGNFDDGEIGVAKAKAEIFEGLVANSAAILPRDSDHFETLRSAAEARKARILTFGQRPESDMRLVGLSGEQADGSQHVVAESRISGASLPFDLGMIGRHLAVNALAVLAAIEALGLDATRAAAALAIVKSADGRGARTVLGSPGAGILLLDESYNANPASMAAALANLADVDCGGRRVAVLGDMLELGAEAVSYHEGLKDAAGGADVVLCCGPNMKHLFEALPPEKRGAWAPSSADLLPDVVDRIRPGDAVMVKGSLGSRMAPIVEAIKKRFSEA